MGGYGFLFLDIILRSVNIGILVKSLITCRRDSSCLHYKYTLGQSCRLKLVWFHSNLGRFPQGSSFYFPWLVQQGGSLGGSGPHI